MKVSWATRLDRLKDLLGDFERKPLSQMTWEVAQLMVRQRYGLSHYFTNLLYKPWSNDIFSYVGGRASSIRAAFNSEYWFPLLDNKLLFHLYFDRTPIRTARLLGYNLSNRYTSEADSLLVGSEIGLEAFLGALLDKSQSGVVFAKAVGGMGGYGVRRVVRGSIPKDLLGVDCVFEEGITQHPEMARMHPSSVNTLRIDTFKRKDGSATPISVFMRMGVSGNHVDNASSGGCFAGVGLETGRLRKYGYTLPKNGGRRLTQHPTTGVVFETFAAPMMDKAIALACEAATHVGDRITGWDVAVAKDGPLILEANPNYDTRMSEIAYGGYLCNPAYQEILAEFRSID